MVDAPARIGVGFRSALAAEILSGKTRVDLLELLFEERMGTRARTREGVALSDVLPIAVHGTKLSLGSAEGIDTDRATRLGRYARATRAFAVTEHVAFVRAANVEIGHLSPLPFSREAVAVLARNVAKARRHLGDVPLWLENIAWPLRPGGDEMDEGEFHERVTAATGCDLLLDLGNVLANARNSGRDPAELLARYPVERAAMIHIAGSLTRAGFTYDTHAHAIPEDVFALLEATLLRAGNVPIVLERDHGFELAIGPELDRARALATRNTERTNPASLPMHAGARVTEAEDDGPDGMFAAAQARFARALAGLEDPRHDASTAWAGPALARARDILAHKRVEELLPFLPRLSALPGITALAYAHVHATIRPRARAAVVDARGVAMAAAGDPHLAERARLDVLGLDARFSFGADTVTPRLGPFVGSTMTTRGRCFALRGPGREARVHLFMPSDPTAANA